MPLIRREKIYHLYKNVRDNIRSLIPTTNDKNFPTYQTASQVIFLRRNSCHSLFRIHNFIPVIRTKQQLHPYPHQVPWKPFWSCPGLFPRQTWGTAHFLRSRWLLAPPLPPPMSRWPTFIFMICTFCTLIGIIYYLLGR